MNSNLTLITNPFSSPKGMPSARRIHHHVLVIDTHTGTPMELVRSNFNLAERHEAPESRVEYPGFEKYGRGLTRNRKWALGLARKR
jgi:hypothetical protein